MRLTIRQVFFGLLFISLFLFTLRPIADPDFWWHLRTGELITQTHTIPHNDPFSFTNSGKPWVAHEWLSELIIYGLYRVGNFGLLIFSFSIIITLAFYLSYLRSPQESRPYIAGFVLLLGALASAPTWGVRPQMVSLLFTSLFLYLLDRYKREKKSKLLMPLPLITMFWVNLHAGFLLGLVIIALYIIGCLIEILFHKTLLKDFDDPATLRSVLILLAALIISLLSTFFNPNGFSILIYPFQTLSSPAMQQFIQEWFSPDFHQLMWQPLALFILAFIAIGSLSKKSLSPIKLLLTLVFGYAALLSARNVPLFAITAIPILAEEVNSIINLPVIEHKPGRLLGTVSILLLIMALLVAGIRFSQVVHEQGKAEADTFPKAAVDFIQINNLDGNIFNSYGWGGYLIWRLYPDHNVFIDGRADVYGDQFLFSYINIYRAHAGWQEKLDAYKITQVVVEPESYLADALLQTPTWLAIYQDKTAILFEKK
jgi:hypothetical protein